MDGFLALLADLDVPLEWTAILGVSAGAMLMVVGLSGMFARKSPVLRRLSAAGPATGSRSFDKGILSPAAGGDPRGLMKTFVPTDEKERTAVGRKLAMAGFSGPRAMTGYYLVRTVFGLAVPLALLAAIAAERTGYIALPSAIAERINGLSRLHLLIGLATLVAVGFYGPAIWLRGRAGERRRAIEEGFPNALDLMQISVEAGLGFDAAMIRVGNELAAASPAIAGEFLRAQREIQAGRDRDRALMDMSDRTQVEEVQSFVSVVLQSIQFGSSISDVLTTYAREMRLHRELRAQEKANRLPVQMSAVMASLMLPALLMLSLGPIVIRYVRYFAP